VIHEQLSSRNGAGLQRGPNLTGEGRISGSLAVTTSKWFLRDCHLGHTPNSQWGPGGISDSSELKLAEANSGPCTD
jgi:hypothetical protein